MEPRFIDTLIDRLVADLRRDLAPNLARDLAREGGDSQLVSEAAQAKTSSKLKHRDLVSELIQLRLEPYQKPRSLSARTLNSQQKQVPSSAVPPISCSLCPQFESATEAAAFASIVRLKARFEPSDLQNNQASNQASAGQAGHLTKAAVRRERRRILMSLHPDRYPESERAAAHERFLEAARGFEILLTGSSCI